MEGKKILIIDDDRDICDLAKNIFVGSGACAHVAYNGEEGLRALFQRRPDLVLLDIKMPGMDGIQTLERIRQLSDVPVIMLTVLDSEQDIERSLYGGADDYVTKPFNVRELLARAEVAIRHASTSAAAAGESVFDDGYLHIDLSARRVAREGELVRLTATEFALLAYLIRNACRVCTYSQITRQVWGEPFGDNRRAIQTFIYQLRQKLEPEPGNPRYIVREYGVGYCFER